MNVIKRAADWYVSQKTKSGWVGRAMLTLLAVSLMSPRKETPTLQPSPIAQTQPVTENGLTKPIEKAPTPKDREIKKFLNDYRRTDKGKEMIAIWQRTDREQGTSIPDLKLDRLVERAIVIGCDQETEYPDNGEYTSVKSYQATVRSSKIDCSLFEK